MKELIKRRRMQILVHSCLYYNYNESLISDKTFDEWSKELVNLQNEFPEDAKDVIFHKEFKGFDGSTGFDLPHREEQIEQIALKLLKAKGGDKFGKVF